MPDGLLFPLFIISLSNARGLIVADGKAFFTPQVQIGISAIAVATLIVTYPYKSKFLT
jgi:hypothetical protein